VTLKIERVFKMTKTDLVNVVSAEIEIPKKTVDTVVNAVLEAVTNALKENDKVQIVGFGTFEVKNVAAREGHNPKTGETIQIPESKKIAFTASKVLKDSVN
jgi:DNA-binding protein HU-beta